MFIGYFTERPYQDPQASWYGSATPVMDLSLSNSTIDPRLQADLYHRFFDEKLVVTPRWQHVWGATIPADGLGSPAVSYAPYAFLGLTISTVAVARARRPMPLLRRRENVSWKRSNARSCSRDSFVGRRRSNDSHC